MFHVGQKVVCIRDSAPYAHRLLYGERLPGVGVVYTIRGIRDYGRDELGLVLEEIVNSPNTYVDTSGHLEVAEMHFISRMFRPVRTTDISIFAKMLNNVPVKESV